MQNSMVLTFAFDQKSFLGKTQNCQFKLKFDTETISNIQNSMEMFTFYFFSPEIRFLGKFGPKFQNYHQFNLNFGT